MSKKLLLGLGILLLMSLFFLPLLFSEEPGAPVGTLNSGTTTAREEQSESSYIGVQKPATPPTQREARSEANVLDLPRKAKTEKEERLARAVLDIIDQDEENDSIRLTDDEWRDLQHMALAMSKKVEAAHIGYASASSRVISEVVEVGSAQVKVEKISGPVLKPKPEYPGQHVITSFFGGGYRRILRLAPGEYKILDDAKRRIQDEERVRKSALSQFLLDKLRR